MFSKKHTNIWKTDISTTGTYNSLAIKQKYHSIHCSFTMSDVTQSKKSAADRNKYISNKCTKIRKITQSF